MATATGAALLPLVRKARKVHPAGRILVEDRAREVSMDRRARVMYRKTKAAGTTAGAAPRQARRPIPPLLALAAQPEGIERSTSARIAYPSTARAPWAMGLQMRWTGMRAVGWWC